jgi:hypothetical protein
VDVDVDVDVVGKEIAERASPNRAKQLQTNRERLSAKAACLGWPGSTFNEIYKAFWMHFQLWMS